MAVDAPTQPEPALLDVRAVAVLLSCSPRSVWRMCDAGEFVRPITLGGRLKRWSKSAVVAWIDEKTAKAR